MPRKDVQVHFGVNYETSLKDDKDDSTRRQMLCHRVVKMNELDQAQKDKYCKIPLL